MEYYLLQFFLKHRITKKHPRRAGFFTRRLGHGIYGAMRFLQRANIISYFHDGEARYYYITDVKRARRWLQLKKPRTIMKIPKI